MNKRCTSFRLISFNGWKSRNIPNNMIPRQVQTRIIHFLQGSETLPAEMSDGSFVQSESRMELRECQNSQSVRFMGGKLLHFLE